MSVVTNAPFGEDVEEDDELRPVDDRLDPGTVLFTVYLLDEEFGRITLTTARPSAVCDDLTLGVVGDRLFVNGGTVPAGVTEIDGRRLLVVDAHSATTRHLVFDRRASFVIGDSGSAGARVKNAGTVVVRGDELTLVPADDLMYFGARRVPAAGTVRRACVGDAVLTSEYLLEKRPDQWRLTSFADRVEFDQAAFLLQEQAAEFPPDFPDYRRSPRITMEPPSGTVRIRKIDPPEKPDKNSILKALLPPLGMVAVGVVTSVISGRNPLLMMGMGILSLLTASFTLSQFIGERRERRKRDGARRDEYERYLLNVAASLSRNTSREREVLDYAAPSPAALVELADRYDPRIYERLPHNKDFLRVSLGTGDAPSAVAVTADVDERDDGEDARRVIALAERFATQRGVPVPVNLRAQTVGLVGSGDTVTAAVQNLLFQAAVFHSYREVNLIALVSEESYRTDWRRWRFLPHVTLHGLNIRGLVHDARTRDLVLNSFAQILAQRRQSLRQAGRETPAFFPHYVFTVLDGSHLSGHGINEYLAEDLSELGVTVIWGTEDRKLLPETVTALVDYANRSAGTLVNDEGDYVDREFVPYETPDGLERALRRLSNLRHVEVQKNAVPTAVTFLELYGVTDVGDLGVGERWAAADTSKTLAVPLGLRGKDDIVELNLHERAHGPHGLVAGTTGSGKSEIVQSFLLSLAVNFAPEDVGFLPIDFKGGGMANLLAGLPHLLGSITNLDGAASARALASIRAELHKRQRLFAQFEVNHINGYTRLYKQGKAGGVRADGRAYPSKPLPHLFLVSDEFAELKANQPEFMDELVSTARIGRSLGVHLILATQKPSGVVNDQIWSNSRFKLALKVADASDSNEIIKTPDAASIVEPGRAYLQVGNNEIYELFQSAWSGAAYEPDRTDVETVDERIYLINGFGQYDLWTQDLSGDEAALESRAETVSELEAVVDHIAGVAREAGAVLPDRPWLPPLGSRIATPPVGAGPGIPLGLLDIPGRQAQEVYRFALDDAGHTAVFGSPGYGASTLLQTMVLNLARQKTPEQMQFLLLDFGTNGLLPLAPLPHVADIVTLEEEEKLQKAMDRIAAELADRKRRLRSAGVATRAQYEVKTGESLPTILNVVDGYDALAQDKRKEAIDTQLLQVLREGAALGVYLVLTANRANSIRMNMSSTIPNTIALYLNDENEVATLFGRDRVVQSEILGRGQLQREVPTAIQFFLPCGGGDDAAVLDALESEVGAISAAWTGVRPERIPMVPAELTVEAFGTVSERASRDTLFLGLNKSTAEPESFGLFEGKSLAVFPGTAKQAALIYPFVIDSLVNAVDHEDLVILDTHDALKPLLAATECLYVGKAEVRSHAEAVKRAITDLVEHGTQKRRCIVLSGAIDVLDRLMLSPDQVRELLGTGSDTVQLILLDHVSKVSGSFSLIAPLKENVDQILFGGDLATQRFVENLPLAVRKQSLGKNVLYSLTDDELFQVVIPTAQRGEG